MTEDRIPTAFYEIRHRADTVARCDLGVPDVVQSLVLSMSHRYKGGSSHFLALFSKTVRGTAKVRPTFNDLDILTTAMFEFSRNFACFRRCQRQQRLKECEDRPY